MKVVYTGLESQGKTLFLALKLLECLRRNVRWKKKYGFVRKIWTNMDLSPDMYLKYKEYISYWKNVNDVVGLSGVDIFWDEISSDFSALKNEPLPRPVNRWLRQGAKQGVDIYATAQEFHDIHVHFRRRCNEAYVCRKIIGSDRGGKNKPPVGWLWGFCTSRRLRLNPYNELAPEFYGLLQHFGFVGISKQLCNVFNTYQLLEECDVSSPLEHVVRKCPVCKLEKIIHR